MILKNTVLDISDNSGARKALCIGLPGNKSYAEVGDIIVVSIKSINPKGKVSKGKVYKAVIVRTRGTIRRYDGSVMRFSSNAAIIVNLQGEPLATRVSGPVRKLMRFPKVMSLATEVI